MKQAALIQPAVKLWLVRHGQTDWNLEGRYQGQADLPLNTNGLLQAKEVAQFFIRKQIAAIYSSDLQRAFQTASAISNLTGVPVQVDQRLREINQGILEGQLFSIIKVKYPELMLMRRSDPLHARPPGGETVWEVAKRVYQVVNEISTQYAEQEVVIVSHGLSLATLLVHSAGAPLENAFKYIPDNAAPLMVEWRSNGANHPSI